MKPPRVWLLDNSSITQPAQLIRWLAGVFWAGALLLAFIAPLGSATQIEILLIAAVGSLYLLVMWLPLLPGGQTLVDRIPLLTSTLHVFIISGVVRLFIDRTPLIAVIYLLAITGVAFRRGLPLGLWTALLSAVCYLSVLAGLGALAAEWDDAILLTLTFISVALFTGALARLAQKRSWEFENVLRQSRDGIVIFDDRGKIEYLNPALLGFTGYALHEILGQSFFDFIADPADLASLQKLWQLIAEHPVPNRAFTVHIQAKDHSTRILSATLSRLQSAPPRYMAIMRDITLQETERLAHDRRDQELDAERRVAHAVSASLDLEHVLHLALDQALATLPADAGSIYLADDAQTKLDLAVARQLPNAAIHPDEHYQFGEGIAGRCAAQKQTLSVANLGEEPAARAARLSQVSVPLIAQDRVVGVLNVNRAGARQFSEADAALLRAIAASVAIAVDHARLFGSLEERIQARTAELAALHRIAQAGNRSLDLDAVLRATLAELIQTTGVRGGWVSLLDHATQQLSVLARVGVSQILAEKLCGAAALPSQARSLAIAEVDPHLQEDRGDIRSICCVPLIAAEQTIGALGLVSDQAERFGETEMRWLLTAGNTIALAARNAQAHAAVARQVTQLAALRDIDHTLNSTLELEPMLEIMLTSIAQVLPYDYAVVYLRAGTQMRAIAARGIAPTLWVNYAFETAGNLAFAEMARERKPIIIDDLDPRALHWSPIPGLVQVRSWLGAPLIARDAIIGQIGLYSSQRNMFKREQADWMLSFAHHAAVTIANALLRVELNEQARRDSLTQVLNHGAFIAELRAAYAHALARREPLTLIMLDLDNFKRYNDIYGHVAGDLVLQAMVQAIRTHIHQDDLVGRWGGEEFGVAIRGASMAQVMQIAERIRQTLAATIIRSRHGDIIPPPTASQGVASMGGIVRDPDDLIEYADRALYLAKNSGRDQVACANDMLWVT